MSINRQLFIKCISYEKISLNIIIVNEIIMTIFEQLEGYKCGIYQVNMQLSE